MAEPHPPQAIDLGPGLGAFRLVEVVTYPNGGSSSFYQYESVTLIVDDDICKRDEEEPVFDYSRITSKQNEYVSRSDRVYRFLREDIGQAADLVTHREEEGDPEPLHRKRRPPDRENTAEVSPLEADFERHFCNVYGSDSARYLWREYGITDMDGHDRFIDYLVQTDSGLLGVEENGVTYHHPQIIGKQRYRDQLLKQNSCQREGIKLFRFSTEDCRFSERLEDDIRSYFGDTPESFIDAGLVINRPVALYEHQEGALEEIAERRAQGDKSFLAVFPTASGKSRIVMEDLSRFAAEHPDLKALVTAPTRAIVDDWRLRLKTDLPELADQVLICTHSHFSRHYGDYYPDHFDYIVIDEAHHAVAPALKRAIQHFDPQFLIGLTATDQRPDKLRLEEVFGSYRVGLSLPEAMERGIIARASAFRIETNIDLSHVRINGKDYVNADLEKTVRVTSRNELIVDVLREYFCEGEAARRQGVIFCVNVRHAQEMERLLNNAGITARAISGKSKDPDGVMRSFREGRVRFLCSCQMISEGWDYPELGILVMARPTLSKVLYLQQLGRGLRRTPTKRNVFVIDVVDEYGSMVVPCSLHSVFRNPCYVPFGDIMRRDYQPGDLIEVDGLHERVERIVPIDVDTFDERYGDYLSVEQLAREFFVSTGTVTNWVKKGRIAPSTTFTFGNKTISLFSPEDAERFRVELGISEHTDETIRDDFFAFLNERDYSLSYKMPFLLGFLEHMDPSTGGAPIDKVLDYYVGFYADRISRGLPVDRRTCPYNEKTLKDRAFVKRSMLVNPFEKFERKRFMYYSKDLGIISINHALQARLTSADLEAIRSQMIDDLRDYYSKLEG